MRIATSAALGLIALISFDIYAQSTLPAPAPPPPGRRAPIGAPPSNEATEAYTFRSRMSVDPPCQDLAQEADRIFLDSALEMKAKVSQLQAVRARAQGYGCLR